MNPLIFDAELLQQTVAQWLWPLFRFAAVLSIMPIFGERYVPVRVRVALALLLTVLIAPTLDPVPLIDPLSPASLLITAQQIVIGVAIGLAIQLVFNAVLLAGESIAITMGLGFALMNDPTHGVQVPTVSQFYLMIAMLVFLALDGHHAVLHTAAASFEAVPIGAPIDNEIWYRLLELGSVIFAGALSIALPGLAALLAVNLVMGVMTRSAPQLNIFSVGFPMTLTVGFVVMLLTLPAFVSAVERLLVDVQLVLVNWLAAADG